MNQREKMLAQAKKWYGRKESDGSFKEIIDIYNEAARSLGLYIMKYTDPWCAAFITACAWVCKLTNIIAPSAACDSMIAWYKKKNRWHDRGYLPKVGDIVFYDWDGNGTGDHVGIIERISGNTANVLEGNCSDEVKYRTISLTSPKIIGFGVPEYDDTNSEEIPIAVVPEDPVVEISKPCIVKLPMLRKGYGMANLKQYKPWVITLQTLLIAKKYSCGGCGADGEFGNATYTAVRNFQEENNLSIDGIVGNKTWDVLFGG